MRRGCFARLKKTIWRQKCLKRCFSSTFYCLPTSLIYVKMLMRGLCTKRSLLQSFVSRRSKTTTARTFLDQQIHDSFQGSPETVQKFAASRRGSFFQEAPRLRNQFNGDLFLQSYLRRILPPEVRQLQVTLI